MLKHGTLTVGFIGLAECLKALIGKHHGESAEAQNLGLDIIGYMRKRMDRNESRKTGFNYSLIATPAEGLSGRFVRIDQQKYGIIPGVTDRDYYTNSFHIPVYYPIYPLLTRSSLEAPYHNLTNGGHISYIELDGDPLKNLDAFEKVVRCMKECGYRLRLYQPPGRPGSLSAATPASLIMSVPAVGGMKMTETKRLSASAVSPAIWSEPWIIGIMPNARKSMTG